MLTRIIICGKNLCGNAKKEKDVKNILETFAEATHFMYVFPCSDVQSYSFFDKKN